MRGFLGSIRVVWEKSGRSDWIRTSDPYPPRINTIAKSLIYRAARSRMFTLYSVSVHPFPGTTQKPHHQKGHP